MSVSLIDPQSQSDAGYFRIGNVELSLPPQSIQSNRGINNEEIVTIRAANIMFKKTGHSRWDFNVSWTAIVDSTLDNPYANWEDVASIWAMARCAPFVEVYNKHISNLILQDGVGFSPDGRMAFAIRQMRVESDPDIIDALRVNLTLTLFNYKPYSKDFGYLADDGSSGPATASSKFSQYLSRWMTENMRQGNGATWNTFDEGTTSFDWRAYTPVYLNGVVSPLPQLPPSQGVSPTTVEPTDTAQIKQMIVDLANANGINPSYALAIAQHESGFNPKAKNPGSSAAGLFQVINSTQKGIGITNPYDAYDNASHAIAYLSGLYRKYGDYNTVTWIFSDGQGAYEQGKKSAQTVEMQAYVNKYMANNPSSPAPAQVGPSKTGPFAPVETQIAPSPRSVPANIQDSIDPYTAQGYLLDHATERCAFMYLPHETTISEGSGGLLSNHVSAVLINTLPQLTFSNQPLPTYQHLGAPIVMVQFALMSQAKQEDSNVEPIHAGLGELSEMVGTLESQFHNLRAEWRAVGSVQRMLAVTVRNKILNLLGITGLMPQSLTTETIAESPELTQGSLSFYQYENIFEILSPYIIKSGGKAYSDAWSKQLTDPSTFSNLSPEQKKLIQPLVDLSNHMSSNDPSLLVSLLQKNPNALPQVSLPSEVPLSPSQLQTLQSVLAPVSDFQSLLDNGLSGPFANQYPEAADRIKAGAPTYNDLLILSSSPANKGDVSKVLSDYNTALAKAGQNPTATLYQSYISYELNNEPLFHQAAQLYEQSPQGRALFKDVAHDAGPGTASENNDHGAYRDLGLKSIASGLDWSPANYFVDYGDQIKKALLDKATPQAKVAVSVADQLNQLAGKNLNGKQFQSSDPVATSGDVQGIIERLNIPAMSLKRAFPTLKVFFMEDDNSGVFNVFDDVRSYSSVISAEVILYQDKPDYMVLTLTNFSNLLTHKLFDNSVLGTVEKNLENGKVPTPGLVVPPQDNSGGDAGSVIGGAAPTTDNASRNLGGVALMDVLGGKIPLQYFPLQTGTKIQVRAGFDNNPDNLFPIFSGTVSSIDAASEVMVVEAEGFLAELLKGPSSDLVSSFGGFMPWSDDGDTNSVMGLTLNRSGAEHFGHWQINPDQPSGFMKGFDFGRIAGGVASTLGAGSVGTLLASGRNRAADNIYINRVVHSNGSQARDWKYERDLFFFKFSYSVPDDPSINAWRIIQDISRRYPEMILCVKPFGFPYGNDATLVFAGVNDYYISRNPTLSDAEGSRITKDDDKSFYDWWKAAGRDDLYSLLQSGTTSVSGADNNFASFVYQQYANPSQGFFSDLLGPDDSNDNSIQLLLTDIDNGGANAFSQVLNAGITALSNMQGANWQNSPTSALLGLERIFGIQNITGLSQAIANRRQQLQRLRQEYLNWKNGVQSNGQARGNGTTPTQPVRRWHLITNESIIHNGITLNDKIYNSVKIGTSVIAANAAIPPNYRRILDVTQNIINPKQNVESWVKQGLSNAYAQSFLREEVGKMYRGELVIAGTPEIQPYDVVMLVDLTRQISGPIEVESVIHSFNMESGFITIIKPRALTVVNEFTSVGLWSSLGGFFSNLGNNAASASQAMNGKGPGGPITPVQSGTAIVGTAAAAGTAVAGATFASVALSSGAALTGTSLFASTVSSLSAGLLALSSWWVLLPVAVGTAAGVAVAATTEQALTPLAIMPLSRSGYPWVGGLQGWKSQNLVQFIVDRFQQFVNYEIAPTLEGFKRLGQVSAAFQRNP